MNWRIKHRETSQDEWIVEDYVFGTKEEAESVRDLGLRLFGGQAEVVCEECDAPVTASFTRTKKAGGK